MRPGLLASNTAILPPGPTTSHQLRLKVFVKLVHIFSMVFSLPVSGTAILSGLTLKKFDSAGIARLKFFKFSNFPFKITSPFKCLNFETRTNLEVGLLDEVVGGDRRCTGSGASKLFCFCLKILLAKALLLGSSLVSFTTSSLLFSFDS